MENDKKFDRLPDSIKDMARYYLTFQYQELPEKPEFGKWYEYTPKGLLCSNDEPYHACIRKGKENKLCIIFCGGGVSINEYTAARPSSIFNAPGTVGYYADDVYILGDLGARFGIGSDEVNNPIKDWTMLFIPYATGDFHAGQNNFEYTATDGKKKILRHHGYINYRALLGKVKEFCPSPEQILVTGFSAGAFATALLTDDIMENFPDCSDVVCCVDSALILYDGWKETAQNVWKTPKAISDRLHTNNITLDSLVALYKKRKEKVKILFMCSTRDAELTRYQSFLDGGELGVTKEKGDMFTRHLREMCASLEKEIPASGYFIFDTPLSEGADKEAQLTQHCIIVSTSVFTIETEGYKAIDWLASCLSGKALRVGKGLLAG